MIDSKRNGTKKRDYIDKQNFTPAFLEFAQSAFHCRLVFQRPFDALAKSVFDFSKIIDMSLERAVD